MYAQWLYQEIVLMYGQWIYQTLSMYGQWFSQDSVYVSTVVISRHCLYLDSGYIKTLSNIASPYIHNVLI
jgi:hypothetical protein